VLTAGLQDGRLCGIDMRTHGIILNQKLHNGITCLSQNMSSLVFVGGQDKYCTIVDIFNNFKTYGTLNTSHNVLAMERMDSLLITGNADGNIQTFDTDSLCNHVNRMSVCFWSNGERRCDGLENQPHKR